MSTRPQLIAVRVIRVLLALGFVGTLAVVGLYLFGRQGRPDPQVAERDTAAAGPAAEEDEPDFTMVSEGFEFALTQEDRVVFEIRGAQQRSARDGRIFLEDVEIGMERDDGSYRISAEKALYNPDNQDSRLEGSVVLGGPKDLVLESDWLRMEGEGRRVFGRGGVDFRSTDLTGRADEIEADLDAHSLALKGAVRVRSVEGARVPVSLATHELDYLEEEGELRARGSVRFTSRGDRLQGSSLDVHFEPETRELEHLELVGAVEAELVAGGRPSSTKASAEEPDPAPPTGSVQRRPPLRVSGGRLEMLFLPGSGDLDRVLLFAAPGATASVEQEQSDGSQARMKVVSLVAHFDGGVLQRGELEGPLDITQGGEAVRRAQAERGEARFSRVTGDLSVLDLEGDVRLDEDGLRAQGDGAFVEMATGQVEIVGDTAHITHPRGELDAPRVVYQRSSGLAQAGGGVKAVMTREQGALGTGLVIGGGQNEEPVYVEAQETLLSEEPDTATFRGQVRAWQGTNTIFADELSGAGSEMTARGNVRTLVTPPATASEPAATDGDGADTAPGADEGDGDGSDLPQGPLNVIADEMTYDDEQRRVLYRGSVTATRDWTAMASDALTVLLDEQGGAREMQLDGNVRIDDSRNQRVLEGERAVYDPATTLVEVFGEPVTMSDAAGGKVEGGRYFVYDLDSGRVKLSSRGARGPS